MSKNWYPLYTKSRFEKKALDSLKKEGYEAYLPLQKQIRQWSDRKKSVEVPLFSSYVFVRIEKHEVRDVLKVNGVVSYIYFNNQPATVRDEEIELLKSLLNTNTEMSVIENKLSAGTPVKITNGILAGYSGKVYQLKNSAQISIEIENMNKTLLVTIDSSFILPLM